MRRIKILSEYKAIIFTILIIVAVAITGFFLYISLLNISKKVSESKLTNSTASTITRQILIELRSDENNVNSFHLSHDSSYITAFYNTIPNLEKQISALNKLNTSNIDEGQIIDSIINLTRERFELFKVQFSIEDPIIITNELNIISQKIDEIYKQHEGKYISNANADTLKKIGAFFKRLFGKKEVSSVTSNKIPKDASNITDSLSSKEKLESTVLEVKSSQMQQLSKYKQSDYQLSQEAIHIMERINYFAEELKLSEDIRANQESNEIKQEVNNLKYYSILLSIIISCFLFLLVYLIRNFIKKKNQYESSLVESKQRAEDYAKTKEAFLANMSHEIKTPLNAIYGFTEQILSGELKPEQERQLNIVKSSASYLTKLVNNILIYAKLQSGKTQLEITNFNLKKELLNIEELFRNQASLKGIQLIFKIDKNLPDIIKSDVNKVKQVLFNILGNAIKFTNEGSVILEIKFTGNKENNLLTIIASDTGIGIEEEKIPKLFNEFEQGDDKIYEKYGGTGLGLVITKQIVEQLNGKINLTSKAMVGTIVTISFPIESSTELLIKNEDNILHNPEIEVLKGTRILIVDDEEFNRLLLKSILKKYDITIFEAVNGIEAIRVIKSQKPDLVIMDIRMPEMNGIEATEEIRKFEKSMPVLASTAALSEEKVAQCLHAGMNGFVFKPFIEKELLENLINTLKFPGKTENINFQISDQLPDLRSVKQKNINLENITEDQKGDEAFRKEMIQLFYTSINNGLNQIEKYAVEKKYSEISEIAHKIIPSCKHYEANGLYNILKYFDNLKNQTDFGLSEFNVMLAELRNQVDFINHEIEMYL